MNNIARDEARERRALTRFVLFFSRSRSKFSIPLTTTTTAIRTRITVNFFNPLLYDCTVIVRFTVPLTALTLVRKHCDHGNTYRLMAAEAQGSDLEHVTLNQAHQVCLHLRQGHP